MAAATAMARGLVEGSGGAWAAVVAVADSVGVRAVVVAAVEAAADGGAGLAADWVAGQVVGSVEGLGVGSVVAGEMVG